ncbi:MAG TPA: right-handed parallel beta-helix repeat-containing protein [Methanosarcina sp.]|jgi:hypothetical protein
MSINRKRLINNIGITICVIIYCLLMFCLFMPTSQAAEITLTPSGGIDDEQQINEALLNYDTVILSNGTFYISKSIYVNDNNKLLGQGIDKTLLQAVNPSTWYYKGTGLIYVSGIRNVEIAGMKIHGGEYLATYRQHTGHDWQNGIVVSGQSSGCSFHDLAFQMLCNDAIRVSGSSSNCKMYNCEMLIGHDGLQLWGGSDWHVYNNFINLNINSGFRFANTKDVEFDHNTIKCDTGSGFVSVELEDSVNDIWIHDNKFLHSTNPYNTAIATVHANGAGIAIEYNEFVDTNPLSVSGIEYIFENNANIEGVIEGSGYDSSYSPGIISTISSYLTPITKSFSLTSNSTTSAEQPQNETTESKEIVTIQNFSGFINDIISVIKAGSSVIDEFVTCLFIMAGAFILVWIFAKVFSRV